MAVNDSALASRLALGGSWLRTALLLDAALCAANGAVYLAAAGVLDGPLGLPADLLRAAGAFLLVFAVAVWAVARRPARPAVGMVVAANGAWALASLAMAIFGWASPSTVGTVWIALQGVLVAGVAELQLVALRGSRATRSSRA